MSHLLDQRLIALRCLSDHWQVSEVDVFVRTSKNQNCDADSARVEYRKYTEGGQIPPYVLADYVRLFPWNMVAAEELDDT